MELILQMFIQFLFFFFFSVLNMMEEDIYSSLANEMNK